MADRLLRPPANPASGDPGQGWRNPAFDRQFPLPHSATSQRLGSTGHPLYDRIGHNRSGRHPAGAVLCLPGADHRGLLPAPGGDLAHNLHHRRGRLRRRHLPQRRLGGAPVRLRSHGSPLCPDSHPVCLAAQVKHHP